MTRAKIERLLALERHLATGAIYAVRRELVGEAPR